MNYPYPNFFIDAQLAKRRFAESLEAPRDVASDSLSPLVTGTAPVKDDRKEAATQLRAEQGLTWSWDSYRDPMKNQSSPKRYEWGQSDMSPFSFTLALLLIGTVAAVHSEDPAFWLLAGPAPLAAVFTATTLFRRRFGRSASLWCVFSKRHD
jgi:hypothetical protein